MKATGHYVHSSGSYQPKQATAFSAASLRSLAGWIGSPLSCKSFLAWSTLVHLIANNIARVKYESNSRTCLWSYSSVTCCMSTYSPSNLTTRGMERWISLQAAMIPLAIVAQFTIPPKMFTKIAFTWIATTNHDYVTVSCDTTVQEHMKHLSCIICSWQCLH